MNWDLSITITVISIPWTANGLTEILFRSRAGWNLYGVGGNALYISFDYLGLWLSRRHRRLTRRPLSTYQFYLIISGTEISFTIKEELLEIIVEANVDTDSGEMGENQAYHYCTGLNDKKEQNIETIYKHSKLNYY